MGFAGNAVVGVVAMLYVALQADVNPRRLAHELEAIGIQQWLYIGEDSTWRVRAEAAMPISISRISIADCLHDTSWEPHSSWAGYIESTRGENTPASYPTTLVSGE